MGQRTEGMEKRNDHEKITPTLFHSLSVSKMTTKILDHKLKKHTGNLWEKPDSLWQQGLIKCCPLSCQWLVLLPLSPQKVNDWICLSPRGTLVNWHPWWQGGLMASHQSLSWQAQEGHKACPHPSLSVFYRYKRHGEGLTHGEWMGVTSWMSRQPTVRGE